MRDVKPDLHFHLLTQSGQILSILCVLCIKQKLESSAILPRGKFQCMKKCSFQSKPAKLTTLNDKYKSLCELHGWKKTGCSELKECQNRISSKEQNIMLIERSVSREEDNVG